MRIESWPDEGTRARIMMKIGGNNGDVKSPMSSLRQGFIPVRLKQIIRKVSRETLR